VIAAIFRAQVLSLRPGTSGGAVRGAVFSAFTATVWYGFWCVIAWSAFGYTARTPPAELGPSLRGGLFLVFLYWQVVPVVTASIGAALDMRKLMIYPIERSKLFQVEVLLRAVSGVEMLLVLAAGAAGLAANPQAGNWQTGLRVGSAFLLFALFNVLLASGSRSLLIRLLAKGRIRDTLVLVGICALLLPRVLTFSDTQVTGLETSLPHQDGLPWTLVRDSIGADRALTALFGLVAWTAVAALFGRWQFERSLRFDEIAAQSRVERQPDSRIAAWLERFYRFPGRLLPDPVAAVVEKELRTLARSPRFRMVFVMGFSFGLLVWLPLIVGRQTGTGESLAHSFLTIVTIYALTLLGQVSYWNSFGFDRSAVQIYYQAPQPMSHVIAGKNLAALVFIYLEAVILTLITVAFRLEVGWTALGETAVVLTVSTVYMLALGNISSVQYPRAMRPERVSQGGASNRFQALVFVLYPLALLPVFLAYVARSMLSSMFVFWILIGLAAVIGVALYWIAFESAVATAVRRRESILQELSKGEGPVAAN
jgi:ABC-2 type transport system permease protein